MSQTFLRLALLGLAIGASYTAVAASKPRARDLGIPFDGTTGPLNAITDVAGIEVGYSTLIFGGKTDQHHQADLRIHIAFDLDHVSRLESGQQSAP